MEQDTRARLEAAGWVVGSADDFAHLTPQESALLDLKENLGRAVRDLRNSREITQAQLAGLMGTTQSRIAKLEVGDPRVSTDFAIRAMIAMATNRRELARAVSGWPSASNRRVRAKTALGLSSTQGHAVTKGHGPVPG